MHQREPGAAHQAFMRKLDEADKAFADTLSPLERLAIAAQFVGQLIAEAPDHYGKAEIMNAVAANMESGNEAAAGGASTPLSFVGRG